jgi:hypothetical protein
MIDPPGVERGRAPLQAMNDIAFIEQNSARYAPSCPVTPVISATRFAMSAIRSLLANIPTLADLGFLTYQYNKYVPLVVFGK